MSWHKDLHDFSVFANLTTIRGVELFRGIAALVIQDSVISNGPHHMNQVYYWKKIIVMEHLLLMINPN